ncbi:DUF1345 domain-containing protein [Actinomyces timonensis]|uniref:DUF1345 domain-containing protein n=1 Tax=Actinomyces timonensis TaxID=1288391 RepID=UPI0002FDE5BD|nr:DUF1345 domain-containing protein [Actinomyces timonensis]
MHLSRALGVVELLLLVTGLVQFVAPWLGAVAFCVFAWIVLALRYVGGSLVIARRQSANPGLRPSTSSVRRIPAWVHSVSDLTPILAAATGMFASLNYLGPSAVQDTGDSPLEVLILVFVALDNSQVLAVVIGILGWLVLHVGYAHLYQRIDALSLGRAFPFPGTPQATSVEYLYLGAPLGATFATSDVEVRTRRARWAVMSHTILAFLYNAVVIGVVVKLITGS